MRQAGVMISIAQEKPHLRNRESCPKSDASHQRKGISTVVCPKAS